MQFDGKIIDFSHDKTWATMPVALLGEFEPDGVSRQLSRVHPRVAKCITALCGLGRDRPVTTRKFRDHPDAGLKEVEGLRIGPNVVIIAKASCWFVRNGRPIIPILQPRSAALTLDKLGIYALLARRAFCRGDWSNAEIEIIDLSGASSGNCAALRVYAETDLPEIDEDRLNRFLKTYIEAQTIATELRKDNPIKRPRKPKEDPSLFPDWK